LPCFCIFGTGTKLMVGKKVMVCGSMTKATPCGRTNKVSPWCIPSPTLSEIVQPLFVMLHLIWWLFFNVIISK
jgi:hypothetical protein